MSVWWGPAVIVDRRVTPVGKLHTKSWEHLTDVDAKTDEKRRIQQKVRSGYSEEVRPQKQ